MGMAAPQSRYLFLTARQGSIELQLGRLSNEKISLARESSEASKKYNDALNKKVLEWSDNAGKTFSVLSYNTIMSPNAANNNTPYYITDKNGKVVLDSHMAKFAKIVNPKGKAGVDYSGQARYEALEAATGYSASRIESYEKACVKVDDTKNMVKYFEGLTDYYQGMADSCVTYMSATEFAKNLFGTGRDGLYNSTEGEYYMVVADGTYNVSVGPFSEEIDTGLGGTIITATFGSTTNGQLVRSPKLNKDGEIQDCGDDWGKWKSAFEKAKKDLEQLKKDLVNKVKTSYGNGNMSEAEFCAMLLAINNFNLNDTDFLQPNKDKNGLTYTTAFNNVEVIDAIMSEYTSLLSSGKSSHKCDGMDTQYYRFGYKSFSDYMAELEKYGSTLESGDTLSLAYRGNSINKDKNWRKYIDAKENYEKQLVAGNGSDKTAYDKYVDAIDARNAIFTAEEITNIEFYDKLFASICENGWVENNEIKDNDFLNNMLQNNQYFITTQTLEEGEEWTQDAYNIGAKGATTIKYKDSNGTVIEVTLTAYRAGTEEKLHDYLDTVTDVITEDSYSYSTDLASNFSKIYSVNDSNAATEAETKYLYEKSLIQEKENRIDIRMQKLQTENSAISQRLKALQSIINENTDALKIFDA